MTFNHVTIRNKINKQPGCSSTIDLPDRHFKIIRQPCSVKKKMSGNPDMPTGFLEDPQEPQQQQPVSTEAPLAETADWAVMWDRFSGQIYYSNKQTGWFSARSGGVV